MITHLLLQADLEEARMAERLAALGLKAPSKGGESASQRAERERKERDDRVRLAEEEDARRETERQEIGRAHV